MASTEKPLAGERAVVTGAASGIGHAIALGFASAGAEVIAVDRDESDFHEEAISSRRVDVTDEATVAELFSELETGGGLSILANVAGVGSVTTVPDTATEEWDHVFDVNVKGTYLCSRFAIPQMVAAGRGSIINMASIAGMVGLPRRAAYCASKGAVIALTKAMAIDHVKQGIRVNCICPGTVDSPWVRRLVEDAGESIDALKARQPMGRLGLPEEIADAALYLAGPSGNFSTGTSLVIDGGLTAA